MNYVIVDVETTGGSPKASKITELAIYKFDGEKIIDEFITLLNPEQRIPDFIVRLTGITDKMVEEAPKFYEVAKHIIEFTEGCIFVAHNVSFDYNMIRAEFKTLGYDFRMPHLCTVRSSRYVIPGYPSYSLGKITSSLGIKIDGRHRAGGDAFATTKLFELLYNKDPFKLEKFIQYEVNPRNVHPNLDLDILEDIPNKAGIYKFFNEFNQIIYIGKSIHIKKRVEQHLRNTKSAKGVRLIQDIARIEYELTGSELIAMLRESNLIKQHKPIYNRQLRKSLFPYGLYDDLNPQGYIELILKSTAKNPIQPIQYFNSKKEGGDYLRYFCEKYELCQKLCSLYKTQGACFQYSIKSCHGACLGEEIASLYNERVNKFIEDISFEKESFFLIDKGRDKTEKSLVWVDNGHFRGYGYAPFHFHGKEAMHWARYIDEIPEDKDIKMIIKSFMKRDATHKLVSL